MKNVYRSPREKFDDAHQEMNEIELLKEILYEQKRTNNNLKSVRTNIAILVVVVIMIPIIVSLLGYLSDTEV